MEPYILTQVTMADNMGTFQQTSRMGGRIKVLCKHLLNRFKGLKHCYLSTSVTSTERLFKKGPKCYW